jgi:hypothetical protein
MIQKMTNGDSKDNESDFCNIRSEILNNTQAHIVAFKLLNLSDDIKSYEERI